MPRNIILPPRRSFAAVSLLQLEGTLPASFGSLKALVSLDCSKNQLAGEFDCVVHVCWLVDAFGRYHVLPPLPEVLSIF